MEVTIRTQRTRLQKKRAIMKERMMKRRVMERSTMKRRRMTYRFECFAAYLIARSHAVLEIPPGMR